MAITPIRVNDMDDDTIRFRIERITEDLKAIKSIMSIRLSPRRTARLRQFLQEELDSLRCEPFDRLPASEELLEKAIARVRA